MKASRHDDARIDPDELLAFRAVTDAQFAPDGRRMAFVVSAVDAEADDYGTSLWIAEVDGQPRRVATSLLKLGAPRWSPCGRRLAFLGQGAGGCPQIHVCEADGRHLRRITDLPGGAGPPAWSPDGGRLAFSAVDGGPPPREVPRVVTGSRYKADGSSSLACGWRRIFVVDLRTSRLESLPAAAANDDSPAWSPDGGQLAFSREIQSNLHYSVSDLWVHDLRHGRLRQLSHRVPHAVAPSWSPDGGRVAFYGASEQRLGLSDTGYGVFVLSPETGRCIGVTERDDRPVAMGEVAASAPPPLWSERGDALVYRVASRGDIHVVELPLAGGLARTLVGGRRQVLSVSMARSGLAYVASDCVSAPTLFAADRCGDHERPLLKLNTDRIATRVRVQRVAFEMSPPSGGVRDAWLFGPRRRNRPLPLLVDVHGGPHGFVGDYFSQGHFYRYVLASRGWLVLMLNATGSGSYGQRFADAIQGRWGRLDGPEHLAAASELVRCGLADRERLAISGYSYGGYLAAWLISHSRRFKAAVIGAPIIDLNAFMAASDIGRWYVPLEMRCREQPNPRLLLGRSPLAYLRRVRTPTFVYHGELDQRCPVGQSEALHTALHGRVPIQFVRYPDSSHGFVSSGRPSFRVDVNRRIVSWLEQHVLGIAPTPEPNPQRGVVVT